MALLELDNVDAFYGRVQALHGVSISVDQTEIVALIGSNGAGKTTTLRTISGLMHPAKGTVTFGGQDITKTKAHAIVGLGICQSPEGRRLFPRMQVIDNLHMGAYTRNDKPGIQQDMQRVLTARERRDRGRGAAAAVGNSDDSAREQRKQHDEDREVRDRPAREDVADGDQQGAERSGHHPAQAGPACGPVVHGFTS